MTNKSLDYVRFDVGHYLHVCHKNTLERFENSVLAKFISPQFDRRHSGDEYIVIDRDGKHFGTILNFMRDQASIILDDWPESEIIELRREADYYCLSELVELCKAQFEQREEEECRLLERQIELLSISPEDEERAFQVPPNNKLEIIYGTDVMLKLLEFTNRPAIIISYKSMRKLHIDTWFNDLRNQVDYDKFNVYCFANQSSDEECDSQLSNFILAFYYPKESCIKHTLAAPAPEKFRSRRAYYKAKVIKFWFVVQNERYWKVTGSRTSRSRYPHCTPP